jgi:tRNA (guanine37-N1)-methyltransferase
MQFDIITIFPHILDSYLKESILGRAQKNQLLQIKMHDLRDYADDKHKTTDDKPFGGSPGMLMMVEPIYRAVQDIKKDKLKSKVVLLSPRGKTFNQKKAQNFAKLDQLIMICGRYEGVDERVKQHIVDETISIGKYVLSGGELPAAIIAEAVARLLPGVLGNLSSLESESYLNEKFDFPQYTRPAIFKDGRKEWKVPSVLLSGNHEEIKKWRDAHRKKANP